MFINFGARWYIFFQAARKEAFLQKFINSLALTFGEAFTSYKISENFGKNSRVFRDIIKTVMEKFNNYSLILQVSSLYICPILFCYYFSTVNHVLDIF